VLLEHHTKEDYQNFFEVGMSHDREYGYGNIHQAWMVIIEKACRLINNPFAWFRFGCV
jgi:hypothetical protein